MRRCRQHAMLSLVVDSSVPRTLTSSTSAPRRGSRSPIAVTSAPPRRHGRRSVEPYARRSRARAPPCAYAPAARRGVAPGRIDASHLYLPRHARFVDVDLARRVVHRSSRRHRSALPRSLKLVPPPPRGDTFSAPPCVSWHLRHCRQGVWSLILNAPR